MATAKTETGSPQWVPAGRGMSYSVLNNELLIRVPIGPEALAAAEASASGKNRVVGTTQGNIKVNGTSVIMGVNVYTKSAS